MRFGRAGQLVPLGGRADTVRHMTTVPPHDSGNRFGELMRSWRLFLPKCSSVLVRRLLDIR